MVRTPIARTSMKPIAGDHARQYFGVWGDIACENRLISRPDNRDRTNS